MNEGHQAKLKLVVAAIADCAAFAVFAAAESYLFGLFGNILNRLEIASLVGTIAKRLVSALATGTPVVGFTFLDFGVVRKLLRDNWICHLKTP
jgi:hypothetical protein